MTVLNAMQSAALRLMGNQPQPMFGGSGTLELELCDLVNEVAQDVVQYRDWQGLVKMATITGDGVTDSFPIPADYSRMMLNSVVMPENSWFWGYIHYLDINSFIWDKQRGFPGFPGGWIMVQDELQFSPAPGATSIANYPYISSFYARADTGTTKAAFTADTDTFLLPERLLTLGLVWRWREQKKLDATGDQEMFIKALDEYAAKDGGSRIQRRRSSIPLGGTFPSWPWALGA